MPRSREKIEESLDRNRKDSAAYHRTAERARDEGDITLAAECEHLAEMLLRWADEDAEELQELELEDER